MNDLQLGYTSFTPYNLTPFERFRIDVQEGKIKLTKAEIEKRKAEAEDFIKIRRKAPSFSYGDINKIP